VLQWLLATATGTDAVINDAEAPASTVGTTNSAPITTADTTATSTAIVSKSKLTNQVSNLAQGMTSSITSVLKQGVRDHGTKMKVIWSGLESVAEHIPYVCYAFGLCMS
jgi:hypothetical protein